jgi:hypothetical protein
MSFLLFLMCEHASDAPPGSMLHANIADEEEGQSQSLEKTNNGYNT